jgi:hypothetical protein
MAYRFATCNTVVFIDNYDVSLVEGRAYDADDAVVRRYPHLFTDHPVVYSSRNVVVEQATAAPGERRTVKRG